VRPAAGFFLAAALALTGAAVSSEGPLRVVVTTTDLKSLVEAVGGDRVVVESLAPAGADPHAVELKASQLAALRRASLVVKIGLDHEPWLRRAKITGQVVDASRGIRLLQSETPRLRADSRPHLHGYGNPHYWLDPENARAITATIAAALSKLQTIYTPDFEANRQRFLSRLDAGLARWREAMAPYKGTRMVVMHETWTYFAARFGLEIVAAVEAVPGVPPTPSEIATLIERMRSGGVRVLAVEPSSDMALANRIAHGSVARVLYMVPSVGADPAASDYVALFDYDVRRFVEVMNAR
jgi:ABC-type Zn uptake system ZnuABC Zn-binding protein ZnuA